MLEATPLAGTLGRACYAPCEGECTRGELEGTLPIRRLKRFADDWHHEHFDGPGVDGRAAERQARRDRRLRPGRPDGRLAAGPQRLRRQDLRGGARAGRLPAPRDPGLPAAGRGRRQGHQATSPTSASRSSRAAPSRTSRRSGATGTTRSWWRPARRGRRAWASPARSVAGVLGGVEFLRDVRLGRAADLDGPAGRRRRRRQRGDGRGAHRPAPRRRQRHGRLPARPRGDAGPRAPRSTTRSARACGSPSWPPRSRSSADAAGAVRGLRCTKMALGAPDASGRRRPEPIPGSEHVHRLRRRRRGDRHGGRHAPHSPAWSRPTGTARSWPTRPRSQTGVAGIFAAGDVVTGPSDITRAVGEGRRAAFMIDRWLTGGAMSGFDDRLPVVDKQQVVARQRHVRAPRRAAGPRRLRPGAARLRRDRAADDRGRGPRGRRRGAWTAPSAPSARSA